QRRELACLNLPLQSFELLHTQRRFESRPGDDCEPGVALPGMLPRFDDDAYGRQLDKGVLCGFFAERDVYQEPWRHFAVEQWVHYPAQGEVAAVIVDDLSIGDGECLSEGMVVLFGIEPHDDALLINLLDEQIEQILADDAHGARSLYSSSARGLCWGHSI